MSSWVVLMGKGAVMKAAWRVLVVCLVSCATGLAVWIVFGVVPGSALAGRQGRVVSRHGAGRRPRVAVHRAGRRDYGSRVRSSGRSGAIRRDGQRHRRVGMTMADSVVGSPLVVSGVDLLVGGELAQAQRNVELMTPEAQSLRASSQTAYEGLSAMAAESVVDSELGSVVDESDGGPPVLPEGERVTGFPSDYAADIALPEGGHAVVESSSPLAGEEPGGGRVPLDLYPGVVAGGFEAVRSSVGVGARAGVRLSEGVSLGGFGCVFDACDGSRCVA